MSADRELLELAAKAAGIDAEWHNQDDAEYDSEHEGMWLSGARSPDNSAYWNPLTDDGDALRLAVKLNLDIMQSTDGKVEVTNQFDFDEDIRWSWEKHGVDKFAATRRSIVRVAAAIGKDMP